MFIHWLIGKISRKRDIVMPEVYPMVFSIHDSEINAFLDWMRNHDCDYIKVGDKKNILRRYSNEEIIKKGLVSRAFEECGSSGKKCDRNISIVLMPSVVGTVYKLHCQCGEEFEPQQTA